MANMLKGRLPTEFEEVDLDRIARCRGIGMTWSSLAKVFGMPLASFLVVVRRSRLGTSLDKIELDTFCDYEERTLSGDMPATYKVHLDKTRFKGFNEQEDKTPQIDITMVQQLEEASDDIAIALGESQELVDSDISDFVSKDSTLGH